MDKREAITKPMMPPRIPIIEDSIMNKVNSKLLFAPRHFIVPISLYLSIIEIKVELKITIIHTIREITEVKS